MNTEVLITCILSSTLAAAIVTSIKEIILWKMNRKATVEDREEDKEDAATEDVAKSLADHIEDANNINKETLDALKQLNKDLKDHVSKDIAIQRALYKQTIRRLCLKYLHEKCIDPDDKQILMDLWSVYHNELEGNGYFDELMKAIHKLPLKV